MSSSLLLSPSITAGKATCVGDGRFRAAVGRDASNNGADLPFFPALRSPSIQGNTYIYLAVYSSVPVYEMMIRGIGVMRRRSDSYFNATQILKVAGVEKGKRTKILEKDIVLGVHEKVQGGYGRYQGTWYVFTLSHSLSCTYSFLFSSPPFLFDEMLRIPFERAVELAKEFGVSHLLAPIFEYTAPPPPSSLGPTTAQHLTNGGAAASTSERMDSTSEGANGSGRKRSAKDLSSTIAANSEEASLKWYKVDGIAYEGIYRNVMKFKLKRSTKYPADLPPLDPLTLERHKTMLKSIFSVDSSVSTSTSTAGVVPNLSTTFPPDLNSDTSIDDHDHTALHWASALARISIVRALVNFGADMHRGNNVGETPLIRAVLVTNNSDNDALPRLLEVLGPSLRTVDDTGRTILHHAALVAGVKGRASSARYYMESVLEYVAKHEKGQFSELVDAQDIHGDTALNIAARVGNKGLVRMLLEVGADTVRPNKLGLRPGDFGVDGIVRSVSSFLLLSVFPSARSRAFTMSY